MTSAPDFVRIINQSRLELEAAGNPSYVVVVIGHDGEAHMAPMVFATVGPAIDHATRIGRAAFETGEQVVIVSRSVAERRAMFSVMDPRTQKKLHQRLEVVEDTFADIDRAV
ncbi:MAG: hypothetical protein ABUM26_07920 [Solirubrobacterales bacterium]